MEIHVIDVGLQFELFIRLLLAGICGAIVGYERKSRLKEAGIRTHFIVALASSMLMVISKYGFSDILREGLISVDPSRVASTIVSGVGFLGAGMIFVRKNTINGLTTAAGIWATAGIGMAIGAGMYFVGIAGTVVVLFVQIVMHKNLHFLHIPSTEQMRIVMKNDKDTILRIRDILEKHGIEVVNLKIERRDKEELIAIEMLIKLPSVFLPTDLIMMFQDEPEVKTIEL
ncbi:MAG: MgtC/SapB family protein [Clostridia bacterium]|nr:MgtC/SapB family protein [Clostridia bacterium]